MLMFHKYLAKIEMLLEENKDLELHNTLEDMHAADISEVLENLEDDQIKHIFDLLSDENWKRSIRSNSAIF